MFRYKKKIFFFKEHFIGFAPTILCKDPNIVTVRRLFLGPSFYRVSLSPLPLSLPIYLLLSPPHTLLLYFNPPPSCLPPPHSYSLSLYPHSLSFNNFPLSLSYSFHCPLPNNSLFSLWFRTQSLYLLRFWHFSHNFFANSRFRLLFVCFPALI